MLVRTACHAGKIADAKVLAKRNIETFEIVFAGIYNIVNHENTMEILDSKMKNVKGINTSIIATANPCCSVQMKLGIQRERL